MIKHWSRKLQTFDESKGQTQKRENIQAQHITINRHEQQKKIFRFVANDVCYRCRRKILYDSHCKFISLVRSSLSRRSVDISLTCVLFHNGCWVEPKWVKRRKKQTFFLFGCSFTIPRHWMSIFMNLRRAQRTSNWTMSKLPKRNNVRPKNPNYNNLENMKSKTKLLGKCGMIANSFDGQSKIVPRRSENIQHTYIRISYEIINVQNDSAHI